MSILQSTLAEEILSRQERAIVRGIHHASQLNEALLAFDKVIMSLKPNGISDGPKGQALSTSENEHLNSIRAYMSSSIMSALINTKVPALNSVKTNNPLGLKKAAL